MFIIHVYVVCIPSLWQLRVCWLPYHTNKLLHKKMGSSHENVQENMFLTWKRVFTWIHEAWQLCTIWITQSPALRAMPLSSRLYNHTALHDWHTFSIAYIRVWEIANLGAGMGMNLRCGPECKKSEMLIIINDYSLWAADDWSCVVLWMWKSDTWSNSLCAKGCDFRCFVGDEYM